MRLFSFVEVAYAQGGKAAQPSTLEILIMPLAFIVIMYFLVIRPQQKKTKEHQALLTALKVGDEVVTTGGIIGRIKAIADSFVTLDAGPNTTLKVQKNHIASGVKAVAKAEK